MLKRSETTLMGKVESLNKELQASAVQLVRFQQDNCRLRDLIEMDKPAMSDSQEQADMSDQVIDHLRSEVATLIKNYCWTYE